MTAEEITAALMRERYRRSFVLPRYTPSRWWECDVFEVTKAAYFREYEVKLTIADFKADAKKQRRVPWTYQTHAQRTSLPPSETKHGMLGSHSPNGPVQFWYVTPKGLLTPDMIPPFAGLIEMEHDSKWNRLFEAEIVPAPRLHKVKIEPQILQRAKASCYWRLMDHMVRRNGKGAA